LTTTECLIDINQSRMRTLANKGWLFIHIQEVSALKLY